MAPLFDPTPTSIADSPCGSRISRKSRDGDTASTSLCETQPKMALGTRVTWGAERGSGHRAHPGWCHPHWGGLLGVPLGEQQQGGGPCLAPEPGPERSRPDQNGARAVGLGLIITPGTPRPTEREKGKPRLQGGAGPASPSFPAGRAAAGSGGGTRSLVPQHGVGSRAQHRGGHAGTSQSLIQVFIWGKCCQGISRSIPSRPRWRKSTENKTKWKIMSRVPSSTRRHSDPDPKTFPGGRAPGQPLACQPRGQSPHRCRGVLKADRRQKTQTKIPEQNPTRPGENPAEGEAGADRATEVSQQRREKQSRIPPKSTRFWRGSAHLSGRERPLPEAYLRQVGRGLQGPGGGFDVLEDRGVLAGVPGHADGFERCQHRGVHQPAAHPPAPRTGTGPGNGEKREEKRGETTKGKEKKKNLRRAGASCAGGRPVAGREGFTWLREGFTWPREEETPPGSGAVVRSQSGSRRRPRRDTRS